MKGKLTTFCALAILVLGAAQAQAADAGCDNEAKLTANKKLVEDFFREVYTGHHVDAAAKYLAPNFVLHNKNVEPGLDGFERSLRKWLEQAPDFKAETVRIAAEGDYVWVQNKVTINGPDGKLHTGKGFDVIRIENGKLVEHWDSDPE